MEKLSDKYNKFAKFTSGWDNLKNYALKWMGASVITASALFGGMTTVNATEYNNDYYETNASSPMPSGLKSININHHPKTPIEIQNIINVVMNKNDDSAASYKEFGKNSIAITSHKDIHKSGIYGGYSPHLNEILIDADILKIYQQAKKDKFTTHDQKNIVNFIDNLINEEIIHANRAQKIKILEYDSPSTILIKTAFELEAKIKHATRAAQSGGDSWIAYKNDYSKTADKIQILLNNNGIAIGDKITDNNIKQDIAKIAVDAFSDEKIKSPMFYEPDTQEIMYKTLNVKALITNKFNNGNKSISARGVIDAVELNGIVSEKELIKLAMPSNKELDFILDYLDEKNYKGAIPTQETYSTDFITASILSTSKGK